MPFSDDILWYIIYICFIRPFWQKNHLKESNEVKFLILGQMFGLNLGAMAKNITMTWYLKKHADWKCKLGTLSDTTRCGVYM